MYYYYDICVCLSLKRDLWIFDLTNLIYNNWCKFGVINQNESCVLLFFKHFLISSSSRMFNVNPLLKVWIILVPFSGSNVRLFSFTWLANSEKELILMVLWWSFVLTDLNIQTIYSALQSLQFNGWWITREGFSFFYNKAILVC